MTSDLARFESRVYPDPNTGCFLWGGSYSGNGYGAFRFRGRQEPAHRVALLLLGIEIPAESQVMHRCDNKGCVNPDHLVVANRAANMEDMARKHRGRKGNLPYGVYRRANGKFRARAYDQGRAGWCRSLGTFDTIEEAALVAAAARKGAQ